MAISADAKSNITFKKFAAGVGTTSDAKEFFLEDERSLFSVNPAQIQFDAGFIPTVPGLTVDGEIFSVGDKDIMEYRVRVTMTRITGSNAFSHPDISSIINPFIYGVNYNYVFETPALQLVNIYENGKDGYFDPDNGILVFLGDLPDGINDQILITCYKYIGRDGTALLNVVGSEFDASGDFGTVKSVVDTITEAAILITTGFPGDRYLIQDGPNPNNNNILFWDAANSIWDYISFADIREGFNLFIDDNPKVMYKKGAVTWDEISFVRTLPTTVNKNMPAQATTVDLDLACGSLILAQPISSTYIQVIVNGEVIRIANGFNPGTSLDNDSKEFDAAFGSFTLAENVVNVANANQAELATGGVSNLDLSTGSYVIINDGVSDFIRRIVTFDAITDIITYDGADILGPATVSKFVFRSYGEVQIGDSLRWFPSYSTYNLNPNDWIDYNYVIDG